MNTSNSEVQDASVASAEATASTDVQWADFAVDSDDEGAFVADPDVGLDTPSDVTPPEPEPTATPPVQSPEAVPAVQPPVQQPPSQTPAAQAPVRAPEELYAEYRVGLETTYSMTQEDAIALATTPESVLPKLAANVHENVMREVTRHLQHVMQAVPQVMEARIAQQTAETEAKQVFFNAWPGLESHYQTVVQNAALVRQANPQATREQLIEMAGTMTAMSLGLDPTALRARQQQQAPRTVAPARTPMRPAAVGSSPNAAPQAPTNPFEAFAEEDIQYNRS